MGVYLVRSEDSEPDHGSDNPSVSKGVEPEGDRSLLGKNH